MYAYWASCTRGLSPILGEDAVIVVVDRASQWRGVNFIFSLLSLRSVMEAQSQLLWLSVCLGDYFDHKHVLSSSRKFNQSPPLAVSIQSGMEAQSQWLNNPTQSLSPLCLLSASFLGELKVHLQSQLQWMHNPTQNLAQSYSMNPCTDHTMLRLCKVFVGE